MSPTIELWSARGELRLSTEFRWKTFGVAIDSTVCELVRHERLAWDAHRDGVHANHAWAGRVEEYVGRSLEPSVMDA